MEEAGGQMAGSDGSMPRNAPNGHVSRRSLIDWQWKVLRSNAVAFDLSDNLRILRSLRAARHVSGGLDREG